MISIGVKVTTSGNLIAGGDPQPMVQAEIARSVRDATEEGERAVRAQLRPGHGVRTGEYQSTIHGTITESMHGEITDGIATVGAWLEGVSSRNERTRFKGYHHFRIAGQEIRRKAQGHAEKAADRIVRRLQ